MTRINTTTVLASVLAHVSASDLTAMIMAQPVASRTEFASVLVENLSGNKLLELHNNKCRFVTKEILATNLDALALADPKLFASILRAKPETLTWIVNTLASAKYPQELRDSLDDAVASLLSTPANLKKFAEYVKAAKPKAVRLLVTNLIITCSALRPAMFKVLVDQYKDMWNVRTLNALYAKVPQQFKGYTKQLAELGVKIQ